MNQILVSDKVYVTPTLKKKKKFYKIQFALSILVLVGLISYLVYYTYIEYKGEKDGK